MAESTNKSSTPKAAGAEVKPAEQAVPDVKAAEAVPVEQPAAAAAKPAEPDTPAGIVKTSAVADGISSSAPGPDTETSGVPEGHVRVRWSYRAADTRWNGHVVDMPIEDARLYADSKRLVYVDASTPLSSPDDAE